MVQNSVFQTVGHEDLLDEVMKKNRRKQRISRSIYPIIVSFYISTNRSGRVAYFLSITFLLCLSDHFYHLFIFKYLERCLSNCRSRKGFKKAIVPRSIL